MVFRNDLYQIDLVLRFVEVKQPRIGEAIQKAAELSNLDQTISEDDNPVYLIGRLAN